MELTYTQMQQLTIGALTITEDQNGFQFTRFTPEQRSAFGATFPMWAVRCDFTSGIRVDFHTDATELTVTVAADGCYEVLINDLLIYCETLRNGESFHMDLDGSDHRITLVLPNLTCGKIKRIQLHGECYIKPHIYSKKVAFYGDSITQGSTAVKSSQSYTWQLTRYFDWHSMNFGVGGIRFQPETLIDTGYDPEIVFVALGTNNFGSNRPMELLQENCPAFFDRIMQIYPDSKIVCITPIWRADGKVHKKLGTVADARSFIENEAKKRNFIIVDGYTLVPHRMEYYEDKRLHPNDLGFAVYAQNLIKFLESHL